MIAMPIDIFQIEDGWRAARYQQEDWPIVLQASKITLPMFLQALPEHEKVLLEHYAFLAGNAHKRCAQIQDFGTFTWCLMEVRWMTTDLLVGSLH
jgi:hypothetical protein